MSDANVHWIQAAGLWVLAVATVITVGQRMYEVHRQVKDERPLEDDRGPTVGDA